MNLGCWYYNISSLFSNILLFLSYFLYSSLVIYTEIIEGQQFSYEFGGRFATVKFNNLDSRTEINVTFDPEKENPIEIQKGGWQAILDNFKQYAEAN